MNILIENALVLPMDTSAPGPHCFRGSVGVKGKQIVMVDRDGSRTAAFKKECGGELKVIDGSDMLLMPGLINTHNHAAMTLERSYADDMPLMEWLNDHIWPLEAKLGRDDIYLGTKIAIAEMLQGGTTTFVDMYWSEEAVGEAVEETGIRAILTPTFTDSRWDDFMEDSKKVFDKYAGGSCDRIGLMVAPHSAYTCSEEHLVYARDMAAKYGVGLNIHISETLDEQKIVEERYGETPTEHLYDLGLINDRTLAVHCVHVSDRDMALLKKAGATVVHNPQSNMKLASGIAPVGKMVEMGINVTVGTDGPSSNNDLDMWDELRSASFLQKLATVDPCVLPAYQVLQMATVNAAKAIGKEKEIGRIREGMLADIILIDTLKPHLYPQYDMVANLVYAAKSSDVDTVIVNGEIVVQRGKVLTFDTDLMCRRVQALAGDITKR